MTNNLKHLANIIQVQLKINKVRSEFITIFVTVLIKAKTVNLADIASLFNIKGKFSSNYRRIQRFFKDYMLNFTLIGKMLVSLLPEKEKYIICMDRTNWEFGKTPINILMISIVYKSLSFPLCWELLDKKGHSNFKERIALLEDLFEIIPKEKISYLVADREFDGKEFIDYLVKNSIKFYIRIKQNIRCNAHRERTKEMKIKDIIDANAIKDYYIHSSKVVIYDQMLYIGGKILPDGDYLIIISLTEPEKALEIYKERWSIEKLFNKLKKRGYNLETTHMRESSKLKKLIALISLAYYWAYLTGEILKETYKIKVNPRHLQKKTQSCFDIGLKYLRKVLMNIDELLFEFNNLLKLLSCA